MRIAFAKQALRVLQPNNWTVALYPRSGDFHVDRSRDLRRGVDAVWASIGIPPFASRGEIAHVLAELTGVEGRPYVVDLLARQEMPQ